MIHGSLLPLKISAVAPFNHLFLFRCVLGPIERSLSSRGYAFALFNGLLLGDPF